MRVASRGFALWPSEGKSVLSVGGRFTVKAGRALGSEVAGPPIRALRGEAG